MKSIIKLIVPLVLLGALAGSLWLVKRNQETRRGAAVAETSSSMLPSAITVNAGSTFVVNLWVNTGSTGDTLDAAELAVTYDQAKVEFKTAEPLSGYSLAKDPEPMTGGSGGVEISLLSTGAVKGGAINMAKLTFKSLTGSSQIKAGGKLMITDQTAMWDIATNSGADVVAAGGGTPGAIDCKWCGLGCVDWSIQERFCPAIAPPGGKSCVAEGGQCVIKTGTTGGAKEGEMCGGIRGIMCDTGLICDYGSHQGQPDASGTCVKATEKCIWCGATCQRHNPLADCRVDSVPAPGQSCVEENNQCVVKPEIPESEALRFKTTLAGVASGANCADDWKGQVVVMWGNATKKSFDNVTLTKTDEVVNGLAVFKGEVSMKEVGAKNNLAVFIKGPKQLQTKYGIDGQAEFYNKSGGEVNWVAGKVFDFTKYANLAGDITGEAGVPDGVVDGIDFAYVKGEVSKRSEGDGMKADLNGNCKLESLDLTLLMLAMKDKQEQMY